MTASYASFSCRMTLSSGPLNTSGLGSNQCNNESLLPTSKVSVDSGSQGMQENRHKLDLKNKSISAWFSSVLFQNQLKLKGCGNANICLEGKKSTTNEPRQGGVSF